MSEIGADYPRERFLRTPVSTIRRVLRHLDDREQRKANEKALTTARLTQLVVQIAHGFSGSKKTPPKVNAKDFLPYPEWRPTSEEASGPDQPTKFVLTQLVREMRVPLHVYTALMTGQSSQP